MAAKRISMRKIKDILRLFHEAKLSQRQIATCLSLSRETVSKTLSRAKAAHLAWPLPQEMDEATLERRLYPPAQILRDKDRPVPEWAQIHRALKRKGVTLQLLWQEYKEAHPDGLQYSWFWSPFRCMPTTHSVSKPATFLSPP